MSDFARDRLDGADEDRLPWLEAVEEEDDDRGVGAGKLIAAVIVGLIALGLVVGGLFWLRDQGSGDDAGGQGELIAAPAGNYKEKPSEPGGMKVEGAGDVAYGASEGAEVTSTIDLTALPEAPIAGPNAVRTTDLPASSAKPAAAPAPAPVPAKIPAPAPAAKAPAVAIAQAPAKPKPLPVKPVAAPASTPVVGGGAAIQLGAFSSEAKANSAWKSLSERFAFLNGLSSSVTPVTTDGGTLYRLRASAGAEASKLCARLKIAGESCVVVN